MAYLERTEPDAVKARRHRRFKRRRFYAAGVSDVWCLDQHDKWGPRFGLWLHNCIDPFIGFNNWLKVWWTNKNPRLIASYYLETVQKYGGQPGSFPLFYDYFSYIFYLQLFPWFAKVIQEAKIIPLQIFIHWHGTNSIPALSALFNTGGSATRRMWRAKQIGLYSGETSHLGTKISSNQELTRVGMMSANQLKSTSFSWVVIPLKKAQIWHPHLSLVFRWLAIPWLQSELDKWVTIRNRAPSRSNTKKVLPHGIPELMRQKPGKYDIVDFKVCFIVTFFLKLCREIFYGRYQSQWSFLIV